jgi:hypothetical protein
MCVMCWVRTGKSAVGKCSYEPGPGVPDTREEENDEDEEDK